MTNAEAVKFWAIVRACLTELYDVPAGPSLDRLLQLAERLQKRSGLRGIIYHSEPIHVAANLAGRYGNASDETWAAYERIVDRIESETGRLETVPDVGRRIEVRPAVRQRVLAVR